MKAKLFAIVVAGLAVAAVLSPTVAAAQSAAEQPFNQVFITHHTGTFGGQKVNYSATVKSTVLTDAAGAPAANFVSTDYVRDGVANPTKRPVIFAFAGGPSGPSVAYHIRLLGPKEVIAPAPGHESEGAKLRDNPDGLLDVADLVFVDPAETGFTRVLPAGKRSYYYSVGGDAASIIQFMETWLKDHGREASPRYVMGGSYGSVRAVRIAWELRNTRPVDGIIMTANSLMQQEMVGVVGVVAGLPTMAMTAIYHGKGDRRGRTDQQVVDQTYRFAINEYLPALSRAQDLSAFERAAMADKLHRITGLPTAEILAKDLAVSMPDFMENLLRPEGRRMSDQYDGRVTVAATPDPRAARAPNWTNESFLKYMADDLGVTYPMKDYRMTAPGAGSDWDFSGPNGAPRNDWPGMLKEAMEANPRMLLYSANGFYDLRGVMGQAHWAFSRTKLPRGRIYVRQYAGGHALYETPETAGIILRDLRQLLAKSS